MRILHIASGRLFGGVERMLATVAACDAAADGRMDSWFVLCAPGRALDEIRDAGGCVECLGDVRLSRPASVLRARARVRQTIGRFRIDVAVCHAPWAYAVFAPVARRAGVHLVLWQHDAATGRPLVERWARMVRADLVICNSRWTARTAVHLQPAVRAEVLYCPVDAPPGATEEARRAVRRSFETERDSTVVLSAARLEPWKGQQRLLRTLAPLRHFSGWTLWIAGGAQRPREAEYLDALRGQAAALGIANRVRWLGERRDMPAVMAAADLLCQPNVSPEPFGVVFAEALLTGIPVVTTDAGGAPEIVSAACGRLVPDGDDEALTAALRELIQNAPLRRALGEAGPAHAASRCDPAVVMPRLAETLRRVRPAAA